MEFIGITAGVDAALVLVALITLSARQSKVDPGMAASKMLSYFRSYLVFTFLFLVLISVAMLSTTGTTQAVVAIVADLALWAALSYMIMISFIGNSQVTRNVALAILLLLAAITTIYFVAKVLGMVGVNTTLENMPAYLMYIVWVPVALTFFGTAFRSNDQAVRTRSIMFAFGLLLTTISWVARLQLGVASLVGISVISIVGFALLVGGVVYRGRPAMAQPQASPVL